MAIYEYDIKILIDEEGKVRLKHNCSNLVEFLGVLELAKALGLKFISSDKEDKDFVKTEIDPNEYLKQVQENQVVYSVDKKVGLLK